MKMTMTPEKAIDTITHFCEYITPCDEYGYRIDGELCEAHLMAVRALKNQKIGYWVQNPISRKYLCSECGNGSFNKNFVYGARYCPICGAKMDGDGND